MKLTVIGGGGIRSMFLAKSIANRAMELGITQLVFMDNNPEKLGIYGKMAEKVAKILCESLDVVLTTDLIEAVSHASYVITTIREGGDEMRVQDERIPLAKGVLGQETTGAAGLSFAIRSVSVLAKYCELIKKYAEPNVKVFNFTNPAGIVSQALRDMGYDFTYGVCDAPSGMLHQFADLYGVGEKEVTGEVYGLNHLSYFRSIKINGKEAMQDIIENDEAYKKTDMKFFEKRLLQERGCILNEYLYYFYYREKAVNNILSASETRGESICRINKKMTSELSKMDIENDFNNCLKVFEKWYGERENSYMASETGTAREKPWRFDLYSKDTGGYAGVALNYIEIANSGENGSMILCVPNNGAINGLRDEDVVEITCDICGEICTPRFFGDVDSMNLEIIRRVKAYERLASKAVIELDKVSAVNCLTLHPLVNSYSLATEIVDEYWELNREYIDARR